MYFVVLGNGANISNECDMHQPIYEIFSLLGFICA